MPTRNLDIVGTSYAAHLTKKVTVAGALLIAPIFVSAALWVIGTPLPLVTVLSLPLALLGWFIPDLDLAQQAAKAREEFHLTVATYVELTGMAAKSGLSPSQALEVAAESGNSWVFERLQNANLRSRFASEQPWVGLTRLAKDSDVPELTELADIMKVGAEQGSIVYESLRAKGRTQRLGILNRESIAANEATERMTIPMTLLGIVFVLILVAPSLMNLLST
ncbi:MAG: type II secretion system F family protein [Brevibacterium aurantiacum]